VKRLVDIDDDALEAAQQRLGTSTMKDTVNTALKLAAGVDREPSDVSAALDTLAAFDFADRSQAWR
jgi:Arc/MetJ family transcription regulator